MSRAERAKELFQQGYACSQAVVLAFADVVNVDEATLKKIALPFGGGMGRLRLTCGAVSGMAMVLGLIFSESENTPENKKKTYAIVQDLCGKFQEQNGTLICAELLTRMKVSVELGGEAEARTAEYYKKRSCGDIVHCVTQIIEDYLIELGRL